jgi:dUTP pyrophosphatase
MKLPYFTEKEDFELKHSHEGDAGYNLPIWDERLNNGELSEDGSYTLRPMEALTLKTGVHIAFPYGKKVPSNIPVKSYGQLDTRSGTSKAKLLLLCHTIDAPFRGNIRLALINLNIEPVTISNGMEIAQIIPHPFEIFFEPLKCSTYEEFLKVAGDTARGTGGFNSTGGGISND